MSDDGWTVKIDADGTWLCEHSDLQGNPAPPSRLATKEATIENPRDNPKRQRGWLWCPDCGTYWRIWKSLNTAKQYVLPPVEDRIPPPGRYRRLRQRDIDEILAALRELVPGIEAAQHAQYFPGDDDDLWFFRLPSGKNPVQIESANGDCPFIIAANFPAEADSGTTVAEVVVKVSHLLKLGLDA